MQLTNKNTFLTQYVAQRYNISERGLRQNLTRHADELIENIHYFKTIEQTNGGRQEILKWTLRGIIKLGMFIRSKEAKNFRLWAEQELKQKQNVKDSEIVRLLNKIQYQMDGVYSEIGAVMAYVNDNDRFFIEHNQFLKG